MSCFLLVLSCIFSDRTMICLKINKNIEIQWFSDGTCADVRGACRACVDVHFNKISYGCHRRMPASRISWLDPQIVFVLKNRYRSRNCWNMTSSVVKSSETQMVFRQNLTKILICDGFEISPRAIRFGDDAAPQRCEPGSICWWTTIYFFDDRSIWCGYFGGWNIRIWDVRVDFARPARPAHVLVAGNFFKVTLKIFMYLILKFRYFPMTRKKFGGDSSTWLSVTEWFRTLYI